jgi:putative ABC transport system permease protein
MVVGADPGVGRAFPLPYLNGALGATSPETVLIDRSNIATLGISSTPADVEISHRRARVGEIIDGFGSFIGTPYVFTDYTEGGRYLSLGSEETMFLLVRVTSGYEVRAVQQRLKERLPEADVWTQAEFARRAQSFWITQTGAGGTILTAALLGFLVGLVIVSQNIYATTMENIEEFATLKAIGASRGYIRRVVLIQALVSGLVGSITGLGATFPLAEAVRGGIPWLYTPWWLPLVIIVVSLLMCGLASIISIRKAMSVEPGRVFRA